VVLKGVVHRYEAVSGRAAGLGRKRGPIARCVDPGIGGDLWQRGNTSQVMGDRDRRRRSRSGQLLDAVIWGTAVGAASGAVLGDRIDGVGAGLGALIGAALYAPAEAITSISRAPAEPKPLWLRILSSALLMALFGWLLGLIYGPNEPMKRLTAAGMLVAEQQFRRIIGYRDLAKLVIAIERHAILATPKDQVRQEVAEPVTA
jgi:hypothetical protein